MGIDFYYMPLSAPCRGVMLTAKAIGVDLNLKMTNLEKGEHMTPEFLKMNIRHTIPTMNDSGFFIAESRAAMQYLMNKYAPDNELYPKDPVKRAHVDEMLFFDVGVMFERFVQYVYPVIWGVDDKLKPEKKAKLEEALQWFDHYIQKNGGWAAGDKMTIADFSTIASITTMEAADIVDLSKYGNITAWMNKCKTEMTGFAECNTTGTKQYAEFIAGKLVK